ncbi:ABC transporter substrate-binding protein [Streptomyces sp. NPDC003635]
MNNAKIGAAFLGGYVLGRTKRAKLALGLGAALAGSRVNPAQLGKTLQGSPFVNTLTKQVRTELTGAGKAAATSVLTAKADHLADALHDRTSGLREKGRAAEDEEPEETDEAEEPEEEEEEEPAEEEPEQDDEEEQPRAKTRRRSSGQGTGTDRAKKRKSSAQGRSRSGTSRTRSRDDG